MLYSIMLLDDNIELLELTKCNLESIEHVKIHEFSDPIQALHSFYNNETPDLIITDYDMPEMNGFDFLEKVSQKDPAINAILFTSQPDRIPAGCRYPVIAKNVDSYTLLYEMAIILLHSIKKEPVPVFSAV